MHTLPYESRISATSCRTDMWCDPVRRKTSSISRPSGGTTSRLIESVPRPLQKRLWRDPFIGVDFMFERPRGTNDWGPEEMAKRRFVESRFIQLAESFGFREVSTPTFESLDLFTAKSGPGIVRELYAFKDQGGRDLALRPEFTASILRFYVSSLRSLPKPLKLYTAGNAFRYEEPQKGRYREFYQLNAEIIGGATLPSDAEALALAIGTMRAIGLKQVKARIGNIGILRSFLPLPRADQGVVLHSLDKRNFPMLAAERARPRSARHGGGGGRDPRSAAAPRRIHRPGRRHRAEESNPGPHVPPGRGARGRHRSRRTRPFEEPGLRERDRRPFRGLARGTGAEGGPSDRSGDGHRRATGGRLRRSCRRGPECLIHPSFWIRDTQFASWGNSFGIFSPAVNRGEREPYTPKSARLGSPRIHS